MEFNILEVRKYFNKENINSPLIQDFIKFEHAWTDHTDRTYNNDLQRSLDHCENMINGKIAEIIFNKYIGEGLNLKYREKLGYYTTNRNLEDIGKTDFIAHNGNNVEFKAFENTKLNEDILKELNNPISYKYTYHECDELYVWLPYSYMLKHFIKVNGVWVKEKPINFIVIGNLLEKMSDEYFQLKVEKIVC